MQLRIACVTFLILLFAAGNASANLRPGTTLLTLDGSYVSMVTDPGAQTIYGPGGLLTWEKLSSNANWTGGFRFHYFTVEEDYIGSEKQNIHGEYDNILLQLTGRYFLDFNSAFHAYAGMGFGFRFATFTITTDGDPFEDSESKFALSLPLGVNIHMTDHIFLDLNYTFNFLSDASYLRHDIVNSYQAGLGFQWGGTQEIAEEPAANDIEAVDEGATENQGGGGR